MMIAGQPTRERDLLQAGPHRRAAGPSARGRGDHVPQGKVGISGSLSRLAIGMSKTGREILEAYTVVAVVGASRDPNKAGGSVPAGLQRRGFRIIPINPPADMHFCERVYRTLAGPPVRLHSGDVCTPT